ncbi:MAG TPA: hypothetical protein VHR66_26555, partial [Gemmataceae bacterium]|nr:hypothetical protein [Gemmataceae bacterium]
MSRISRLFRSTSTRPQSAHKARFGIVALEGRDVPSTLFSNGVLSVAGTTGNDSIEIFSAQANQTRVVVNGHVDFDGAVAISQIKINGREGLDNVNVHGIQAGVTDGVHVINVETVNVADQDPLTGQKSTASIRSNLSVENANFLLVNNSAATANAHLEISDTQVTGIAPATISYTFNDPNATLILQTGAGSDTLNVNNTPVGTTILNGKGGVDNFNVVGTTGAVQINGGTGADNIHIVPTTSTLADIGGQITVSDGLFQDKVDINDIRAGSQASSLSAYSATLSADRLVRTDTEVFQSGPFHFFRDDSDTIVYQGVASVRFVASFTETPSSTVSVLSTNAGTKTTIVPEETQFVTFGNLSHRLDSIDGPVTVQDGRAHTQLVFDDVGTLFGQRYTLGADTVQRNGMATVTLDHFPGQLEVNAGRRADVFNVTAPRTGDFFRTLDGNGGSDILIAPHGDNDWKILGQNLGLLNLSTTFIDVDSLDGSAGADTFNFANGVGVSGKIDGAGGFDTLNYSDYTTGVN